VNELENEKYNSRLAKAKFVQSQINSNKKPSYQTVLDNITTYVMVPVEEDEDE